MELVIWITIAVFVFAYRLNNGDNGYQFFADTVAKVYNTYAPYSFREVREKRSTVYRVSTKRTGISGKRKRGGPHKKSTACRAGFYSF